MTTAIHTLAAIICFFFGGEVKSAPPHNYETYNARITYYWPGSDGQVGQKTSTGKKAIAGNTVAVDPKIIPYGSKVEIPRMGGCFFATDTGSGVVKRTASRKLKRKNIVVDVFCKNRAQARTYEKQYPMFMDVKVFKK